jgi:hypothetical protein
VGDPRVYPVGALSDIDGLKVEVGVDYDTVFVRAGGVSFRLGAVQRSVFLSMFIEAVTSSMAGEDPVAGLAEAG